MIKWGTTSATSAYRKMQALQASMIDYSMQTLEDWNTVVFAVNTNSENPNSKYDMDGHEGYKFQSG